MLFAITLLIKRPHMVGWAITICGGGMPTRGDGTM